MQDSNHTPAAGAPPINWIRVKEIFSQASETAPPKRAALLEELCGSDALIRHHVEGLLRAHSRSDSFMTDGDDQAREPATAATPAPGRIGPYELLERLGEGGFGVVYRARQESPVEREVAIKLIRPGFDSPDLIARFSAERRVLAKMDHADIVKVFDAGATPDGRLFIVMELVRGKTIVEYCRSRSLNIRARIGLFARVCRAIHHAHQRAVIHRDLKPSNILVSEEDGLARPRIIDFGIARAMTDEDAGDEKTRHGHILGTPKYISPEQAGAGAGVDIRSDIYSLGVLLCEVLTGHVPRDPKIMGMRPPKEAPAESPSRILNRTGADGSDLPERAVLAKHLRGDLDRIVLKCVAWDAGQRYDSAAAMADDLERYLRGEPVRAVPPSRAYLLSRFVRRNRWTVSLGVAAMLSLVIGLAAAIVGFRQAVEEREEARSARREADRQTHRAEFVTSFLLDDMLGSADPAVAQGHDVTVRELLDLAAARADERFAADPQLRLDVLTRLGRANMKLEYFEKASSLIQESLALSMQLLGPDAAKTIDLQIDLAEIQMYLSDHTQATERRLANSAHAVAALGPDHPVSLRARRFAASSLKDPEAYLAELASIRAAYERAGETNSEEYVSLLMSIAVGNREIGRFEDELMTLRVVAIRSNTLWGERHPRSITVQHRLVKALLVAGEVREALETEERTCRIAREVHGDDSPNAIAIRFTLLPTLIAAGRAGEAVEHAREIVSIQMRVGGEGSVQLTTAQYMLGFALLSAGEAAEALPILQQVYEEKKAQWGARHSTTIKTLADVVQAHRLLGDLDEAVALVDAVMAEPQPNAGVRGTVRLEFAQTLDAAGRFEEARPHYIGGYDDLMASYGPKYPSTVQAAALLADFLERHPAPPDSGGESSR
mgnify:CR=1 FL=1